MPLPAESESDKLYARFRAVIIGAGYTDPRNILREWFPKYIQDIPEFERMLKSYEDNDFDPD